MKNEANEEIIRQAVNKALSNFNTEGKSSFWTNVGILNVRELYNYLLSQPNFDTNEFKASSNFGSYLKTNIRKFNLFGKLDLSVGRKEDKSALAEELIESFNYALVEKGKEPNDDDYVLRTKEGNGGVVFYSCGKLSEHEINVTLKAAYKIREGVKYFDVRVCTYKNWKGWSDERQQASSWRAEMSFTR